MFVFQPFIYYSFHILTNNYSFQIWNCEVYSTIFVVSLIHNTKYLNTMKNTNTILAAYFGTLAIAFILSFAPYFIGRFQYNNACMVIQNLTEQTDGEIEAVLLTFDFRNMDAFEQPTFADYYEAGLTATNF